MRQPVYFNHAVQRLAKEFPEAIWLEAGSNSTITTMASKALGMPEKSSFQPVNVTSSSPALQQLANATMNLWKAGLRVSFWPHSRAQTYQYKPILLPPYQFEKHRQWLDFKPPLKQITSEEVQSDKTGRAEVEAPPLSLYNLLKYRDNDENRCRFQINTQLKAYTDIVSKYIMAKMVHSCPATFEIDLAIQAITSIRPEIAQGTNLHPQIYNIVNHCPIFMDMSKILLLDFERHGTNSWNFEFISKSEGGDETANMSGQLYFQLPDEPRSCLEFSRLERLVTHERCLRAMESSDDAEEVIQGHIIYKIVSDIINYGPKFRGLRKLVGRPKESAGKVIQKRYVTTLNIFAFI